MTAPGPRCATCRRIFEKKADARRHEAYVLKTYGLRAGEYDELVEFQGGKCAICQRATGASKRLAVDHDHSSGLVRGALCSVDNKLLGHFRDDPEALERAAEYLRNPPAQQLFGERKPDNG